jgi:hypothetical protein
MLRCKLACNQAALKAVKVKGSAAALQVTNPVRVELRCIYTKSTYAKGYIRGYQDA